MGVLKDAGGTLIGSNQEQVDGFVRDIFGEEEEGGRPRWEKAYLEWPLQEGTLREMVLKAIRGTSSKSAAGPDGIGYRLIKVVLGIRLGMELVDLIIDHLRSGFIPDEWKEMKMVMMLKPGRDLTLTKNWRPINLINCVGKIGEKVVADCLQEVQCFHDGQYGGRKNRTVTEVVALAVTKAQRAVRAGGMAEWGFWDVKRGFQNVWWEPVMERLSEHPEGSRWLPWLTNVFGRRNFEVVWDGTLKGRGQTGNGVPQGSPLSPVLFLIWMAPIMEDLEIKVSISLGREVELFSYVDDIHVGVYGRSQEGVEEQGGWVERVDEVVGEVSEEWGMPTALDKHERLVIRIGEGRKKRKKGETKWVKWLGIILDEGLTFHNHWQKRVEKARNLLVALRGVGNSEWSLSPRGWRQV